MVLRFNDHQLLVLKIMSDIKENLRDDLLIVSLILRCCKEIREKRFFEFILGKLHQILDSLEVC